MSIETYLEQHQIYSRCQPVLPSGNPVVHLKISQTLSDQPNGTNLLGFTDAAATINVQVNGPQSALTEADLGGVYPASGSDDSPDAFLPHVALTRRTLPWERTGPAGAGVWLALLLVKDLEGASVKEMKVSEIGDAASRQAVQAVMPADTVVKVLSLPRSLFNAIAPKPNELAQLCHLKRTRKGKVDTDCAIVVANRLPFAAALKSEGHTACLVSLEQRGDAYATPANTSGNLALVVLHAWSFTPSKGGDFAQVLRAIGIRPNGGVLRFGNLPWDAPTPEKAPISAGFDALLDPNGFFLTEVPHTQPDKATYRGPLRPYPSGERSPGFAVAAAPEEFENPLPGGPRDYSHAAAFELGRLLALARPDIIEGLRGVTQKTFVPTPPEIVATSDLPSVLQHPGWHVGPDDMFSHPWDTRTQDGGLLPISKSSDDFVKLTAKNPGDLLGFKAQFAALGKQVGDDLGALAKLNTPFVNLDLRLDLGTVDTVGLSKIFAGAVNLAR